MAKKTSKKSTVSAVVAKQGTSSWTFTALLTLATALVCSFLTPSLTHYLHFTHTSPSSTVIVKEKDAVRVEGAGVPMLHLKARGEPLILLHTEVSERVPQWQPHDISRLLVTHAVTGVYRSNDSAVFGTYYDTTRPMHTLHSVHNSVRYEDNVTLTRAAILEAFPTHSHTHSHTHTLSSQRRSGPYYALATSLSSIQPSLERHLDLSELVSLNPSRSSVNLWMSSRGSVTPCHYDGYYNT